MAADDTSSARTTTASSLHDVGTFGGIDADEDDLLRECFQDHPAYVAALEHKKFLIIGRKGSGKTAIYRKLITQRDSTYFSYGHSFNDYPWHHHDLQAETGVPEELRFTHSWRYLILLSLAKIILNQDSGIPWSDESLDAEEKLEDFVVDSYGTRNPDLTQLFAPSKELRLKAVLKLPFLEVGNERIKVRDLPSHVQDVNRQVSQYVLNCLHPDHDYYICFDQLDREFDPTNPKYSQRLIGLILAARDLRRIAKDQGKRLSVVILLRDDIYHNLQFEDKNKLTDNNLSRVEWRTEGDGLTLRTLMEKRFSKALNREDVAAWDDVFDETKQMPGQQTKYTHISARTFLRPRDMIKFCNEVLACFKGSHDSDSLASKFDNSDVSAARSGYSEYLLNELDDEIAKQVPRYREYLEILRAIGSIQFTAAQFIERFKQSVKLADLDPWDALRDLFAFSVIGYQKLGGRGGGSKYLWQYQDPRIKISVDAETFRVHAGFKEALDLVKGARS